LTAGLVVGLARVSPSRQLICAGISNLPYALPSTAIGTGLIAVA
jgi:ABC-type Fe3+ transport system permease subunit